jgi:hypothetical protein
MADIAVQDRLISIDWSLGRLAPVAEYRHDIRGSLSIGATG